MSLILYLAIGLHGYVILRGVRFLLVKHFGHDDHAHLVASITAASTFFVIAHIFHFSLCSKPTVIWYAFSVFNAQLYLSLIKRFRAQQPPRLRHARV